jgi:hypothetical protein
MHVATYAFWMQFFTIPWEQEVVLLPEHASLVKKGFFWRSQEQILVTTGLTPNADTTNHLPLKDLVWGTVAPQKGLLTKCFFK